MDDLLRSAAERATRYLRELPERRVAPHAGDVARLQSLADPLPDHPGDPLQVLARLDDAAAAATVATAGPRYFGFVTGGALPTTLAAQWLAAAWDQNAFSWTSSPAGAGIEATALEWLVDILRLPGGTAGGFVTGATMANFCGILAARHRILAREGWNVEERGLFGAPPVEVVVGEEVHVSLLKALSLAGFGRERVRRVPVDRQGRMDPERMPPMDARTLVCIQAGNVNSGAFDPAVPICDMAHRTGAWVHVDGAFGLWALASPELAHLAAGVMEADSWATDAHKWLNVPYDCGLAFCRDEDALRAAMSATRAAYLDVGEERQPFHYTPEMSRRSRGFEVWAALASLGRSGLADLLERNCAFARRFADGLSTAGHQVLNDVVLNQVVVSFGDDETTRRVVAGVQEEGTCWCGGTEWQGRAGMRISVSSWATTSEDVDRSLEAIVRVAARVGRP